MESEATMDAEVNDFAELSEKLQQRHEPKQEETQETSDESEVESVQAQKEERPSVKKYSFKKGEQVFDIDEDAEFEMMADKKPVKLTLKELKDRAAGDIAVKNRMHALAEEKKRVQATFKEFTTLAKEDPLGALEYIANRANETDSEFEYNKYLEKLGEQAQKLSEMDDAERKAFELEKKLDKANKDLSLKERQTLVVQKKQEILEKFPEIGDQKFGEMVEAVMNDEALIAECKDENDVLEMTEQLISESMLQADIADLIHEVDPNRSHDNELIFAIRDQVVNNPDFDEDDVREIIQEVLGYDPRRRVAQTLSEKQRSSMSEDHMKMQGMSDAEILAMKLKERRQKSANNLR